jgi:diguanylate cyclase (GGDEF)-like protein/PAS domain S-box-containing protein
MHGARGKKESVIPVKFISIFIILAAAVIAAGFFSYKRFEMHYRAEMERELSAISDLKVAELMKWRNERLGDAEIIRNNYPMTDLAARCLKNPRDRAAERKIKSWLSQYMVSYEYDQIRLLGAQGATHVSFPPDRRAASTAIRKRMPEIMQSRRATLVDFYRHDYDRRIYLSVVIPIMDHAANNRPVGALSLRVDPEKFLYRYILRWPMPGKTGEILLVRREGNDALYLNELRSKKDSALNLRIPLERTAVPAVRAVLGQTGIVDGLDYRGEPVMAVLRSVPDTPWFLVTRMDKTEAFAPIRENLRTTIWIAVAVIFAIGASLAFIRRQQSLLFLKERYRSAEALEKSEQRLKETQAIAHLGSWELDLVSNRLYWSDEAYRIFGFQPREFGGTYEAFLEVIHPDDRAAVNAAYTGSVREGRDTYEIEHRIVRKSNGEIRVVHEKCFHVRDGSGRIIRSTGMTHDITERKRLEETIIHLAHHDPLTGLANRRLFTDIIKHELAQANRNRSKVALLFLDLDRFKEINDTFGHETGDELLKEVSKRLRASIRQSDVAARIGGDEFNVILGDIVRQRDITRISMKIMDSFKRPFAVGVYEFNITASMGISIYPDDGDQIEALYRYADIAMYHAKETGRSRFQFYNPDINIRSIERIRMESMLRRSIDLGELAVYYQPQINISSRKMMCAEALVRWKHPEKGLLEPKSFISAAEDTGFITVIDDYVMRTACAQARSWLDAGLPAVCITVNLSARQFQNPDLIDKIRHTLNATGVSPECLNVEITESIAMSNIDRTISRLTELAEMGVHAYIDDFGAGNSSLSRLKQLPIQKFKIDQSFIKNINVSRDDRAIINAVTVLAHDMRISVLAEGVETEEQLSFLRSIQCDEAQGYLFSKALPAGEFGELLAGSR